MDWENYLEKNPIQKIEKTVKIRMKLPHVNKKTITEKPNFCSNTVFSLYFKIRAKKISRRKTTRFFAPFPVSAWPKSLLQFDFKNHENVWTDLKKKTAPQYNSNYLNCKKTKRRPIIAPAISVRLLKNIAGSLPENSRNRLVDRQSQKETVKKTDQKKLSFHWRLICYILTKNL